MTTNGQKLNTGTGAGIKNAVMTAEFHELVEP
jgi:hypothetical protein